jgi:predicted nucleic acid-binding protein
MPSTVVVDSGPLIAASNKADKYHDAALSALRSPTLRLVVPALCVAEVAHILHQSRGPAVEAIFLRSLETFDVRLPMPEDWRRIAELVERYADLGLGGTDASVVALAERLGTEQILTTDHRHFRVVRPRHCEIFRILLEER